MAGVCLVKQSLRTSPNGGVGDQVETLRCGIVNKGTGGKQFPVQWRGRIACENVSAEGLSKLCKDLRGLDFLSRDGVGINDGKPVTGKQLRRGGFPGPDSACQANEHGVNRLSAIISAPPL